MLNQSLQQSDSDNFLEFDLVDIDDKQLQEYHSIYVEKCIEFYDMNEELQKKSQNKDCFLCLIELLFWVQIFPQNTSYNYSYNQFALLFEQQQTIQQMQKKIIQLYPHLQPIYEQTIQIIVDKYQITQQICSGINHKLYLISVIN